MFSALSFYNFKFKNFVQVAVQLRKIESDQYPGEKIADQEYNDAEQHRLEYSCVEGGGSGIHNPEQGRADPPQKEG
jgi:hypothetical protein